MTAKGAAPHFFSKRAHVDMREQMLRQLQMRGVLVRRALRVADVAGRFHAAREVGVTAAALNARVDECLRLAEISEPGGGSAADWSFVKELMSGVERDAAALKRIALLSGPVNAAQARLVIKAGLGGTEAADFASMLFGAYCKFLAAEDLPHTVHFVSPGADGIGMRSAEVSVRAPLAYGLLRGEAGAHRFRRFSPHGQDAGKKRQTSFAQVVVLPVVDDDAADDALNMADVRVETMRASGPGGQGVNTTSSAVRVTHVRTGIVATNQDERSQHRNKNAALAILRGRLAEKKETESRAATQFIVKELGEANFGSQIRTWSHGPAMVKDHRTGLVSYDIDGLLNHGSGLSEFTFAFLEMECGARA